MHEHIDSDGELGLERSGLAPKAKLEAAHDERRCGVIWCVAATLIAMNATDTSQVLALVAALCGAPLMNVLPPLLLLRSRHGMGTAGVVMNVALLVLGVVVSAASAASALASVWSGGT